MATIGILSTHNPGKLEQMRPFFVGLPITMQSLKEAGITDEAEETGITFEQNARLKVEFAWNLKKTWCVSEDSGLCIDFLGGRPGILSARWAGTNVPPEKTMYHTIGFVKPLRLDLRTATFKSVAAIKSPTGLVQYFRGEARGVLLTEPRTACPPGMPYDPIFLPIGQDKVWSEMTLEEKNAISHRGQAFRQVRDFLRSFLV
ncbi:non-canonical purine NTP pyrophosphatase [Candidatus Parcubacteria bacterium]|nr:non-canonical purine NTP pyrophosphatase [Candidatus Parcubacteria bacterium]